MSELQETRNEELTFAGQVYSEDPLADRETGHYRVEYVKTFVEKWDIMVSIM